MSGPKVARLEEKHELRRSNDTSGLERPELVLRIHEQTAVDLLVVFADARRRLIETRC